MSLEEDFLYLMKQDRYDITTSANIPDWVRKTVLVDYDIIIDQAYKRDHNEISLVNTARMMNFRPGATDDDAYWTLFVRFIEAIRAYVVEPTEQHRVSVLDADKALIEHLGISL